MAASRMPRRCRGGEAEESRGRAAGLCAEKSGSRFGLCAEARGDAMRLERLEVAVAAG